VPDEPRRGGPGPRGDQAPQDDQPTGRRRRSLEGGGGLSVSELLEQHSRSNIPRPVPPDERRPEPSGPPAGAPQPTGRRAAPEPGDARQPRADRGPGLPPPEGVRRPNGAPPDHFTPSAGRPAPEETGRRARPAPPPPNGSAPPAEETGRRARPHAPEDAGRRARPPAPEDPGGLPGHSAPDGTGRRARPSAPEDPGRSPGHSAPEDTGRRARPPAEDAGRRARAAAAVPTETFAPEDAGRRARPDGAPSHEDTGRRARPPAPEDTGRRPHPANGATPPEDAGRRARPADAFGPPSEGAGHRSRPPAETGRRALPPPADDAAQRLGGPDATGRRPHPAAPPEDRRRPPANGAPGQRFAPDDPRRPDATGRRPRPDVDGPQRPAGGPDGSGPRRLAGEPDGGPRRLAPDGPAEPGGPRGPVDGGGPRRLAGGPDGSGPRRLAEGAPNAGGPRRPVEGGPGARRPGDGGPDGGPRRLAPGGPDGSGPRRLADGPADGPRRLAEGAPDGPRRLAEGGPDGSGPRRLADSGPDGPRRHPEGGPDGPRRPADGPADGPRRVAEGAPDGPRRPVEGAPDGPRRPVEGAPDGPRRPAGGPDGSGPRPVVDRRPAEAGGDAGRDGIAGRLGAPAPERRDQVDPASLTTEMEAISDDVKKRREVDHTLARFSAVHDELAEQERQRKERRQKLMPWKVEHDEEATVFTPAVEDGDDPEAPRRRVRTPKHVQVVRAVKALSLTAAVIVFVATGLGWGAMLYVDSKFTEIDALNTNSAAVHEAEKQLGDENFLIVGSDTRAGAKPEDGVGDAAKERGARSDVLMLAHIPADRKRVVVVSVPRDLQITRPECEKWDSETGEYTGEVLPAAKGVKANQAYADGGPKCVSTFMTELTGLTINHFVSVDFNGFKGMVDAIGKINICVPKVMDDGELGMIFDKPGRYDVDGQKALDYVRARHVKTEEFGDYDRVTRQQKFMSSLLRTALSSEMLLNPGKLNNFLNAFAASTVGQNIGVKDMLTLAQSLQGIEAGRVSFVTVPHATDEGPTTSNDDNIEMLKVDETRALFQAIIDGTPLPGEAPEADAAQPPATADKAAEPKQGKVVDPKGLKIQVFNGDADNDGAAGRAKNALSQLGFVVVNSGTAPPAAKTVIRYGAGGEDAAFTLAKAVPGAVLEVDASQGGAVTLLIGPGWDEQVVAPKGEGAAPEQGKAAPPEDLSYVNAGADPCS